MSSVPSYTVDRETAATLREWLFENAVEKHGESEISEPLAELAAAIDGVLYEEPGDVELGAWAQTVGHRDTSHVDGSPVDEHRPDDARDPAEPDPLDAGVSEPDPGYDTRPDSAWQPDHEQSTTNREQSPTAASHDKSTAASNLRTRRQNHRPSVRYRTAYECSVCGSVREVETSLRVCAFIDECANCGAVARFTADGIPTPFRKD
ncbi:MAG: hypothetical protein ABEI52_06135 [Halobacteriaceae archaeon]